MRVSIRVVCTWGGLASGLCAPEEGRQGHSRPEESGGRRSI